MPLPPESIEEFKKAYQADFDIDLTDSEAQEMAQNLLTFYQLIIPKCKK